MPGNALAVFAPKAPVEPTAPTQDRAIDNGSDFKDYMDTASQKVDKPQKAAKENSSKQESSSQTESVQSNRTQQETRTEQESDYQEVATTNEYEPKSTTETVSKDSLIEDNQTLAATLQELDISQEQFETLLSQLGLDGDTDLDSLIQSLSQSLGLNQNGTGEKTDPTNLIAKIQQNEGQAVNFLKQAGLSEAQAKGLIDQLQTLQNASAQKELNKGINLQAKLDTQTQQSDEAATVKLTADSSQENTDELPDFLTQFKDATTKDTKKGSDKNNTSSSAEKLTEKPNQNEAPRITTQDPITDKNIKTANLGELLNDKNAQANILQTESFSDGKSVKGLEAVKTGPDLQIQSPAVTANTAVKAVEASKPILPETVLARGATEAKIISQITDKMSIRTNGSQNEVHVKLDPPSLGTVRMNIITSGDSVRTVIVAENQAVKQVIENNFNQLRDAMGEQGLKVDSFTVTVGGESDQQNPSGQSFADDNNQPSIFNETASNDTEEAVRTSMESVLFGDNQSISVIA